MYIDGLKNMKDKHLLNSFFWGGGAEEQSLLTYQHVSCFT
jgi:hypothetical protein